MNLRVFYLTRRGISDGYLYPFLYSTKSYKNIFELLLNLFTRTRFEKQLEIVIRTISFTWTPDNHQGVFRLQHDPYFGR